MAITHNELIQAVRALAPNARWSGHTGHNPETGTECHVICWHDQDVERPADAAILAEVERQRAEAKP